METRLRLLGCREEVVLRLQAGHFQNSAARHNRISATQKKALKRCSTEQSTCTWKSARQWALQSLQVLGRITGSAVNRQPLHLLSSQKRQPHTLGASIPPHSGHQDKHSLCSTHTSLPQGRCQDTHTHSLARTHRRSLKAAHARKPWLQCRPSHTCVHVSLPGASPPHGHLCDPAQHSTGRQPPGTAAHAPPHYCCCQSCFSG